MKQVKNANGKLVCELDETNKTIEIVQKGFITTIRFLTDGNVEIENTKRIA